MNLTVESEAEQPETLLLAYAQAEAERGALGRDVWERSLRLWHADAERAIGVVASWGMKDDAIAGRDIKLHLQQVEGRWQVEDVFERYHCRRGVSDDGLCL
ncbi:hypothetical protein CAI21_18605 [Alkalilimnicola ehrlichii]|uniref:SnoaL-like domain-containing protein n=1 Tax=Alkalilimnicola ehrlichii TaxID=351052 RepID=A0A3E0WLJ9_9GAMM|nr:hypothetical protein [Alkalilimnicola ehrlichii]RFA25776.1 hypothetical protein CAI21_18605 [Alkalilimnicola ehrlichii]RFA32856.1 hypothetical protein CAL65_18855 [Alkalilimnicola ehrlichii]